jgi:hypothetical protein
MALVRLVVKMRKGGKRGHQSLPRPGCAGNNGRFEKARTGSGVPVFLVLLAAMGNASAATVILDRGTFGNSYALLRAIADRVGVEVDRLIPGQSAAYSADGIFCYVGPGTPITLVGAKGDIKIALSAKVLPANYAEFVFELSHELAHVKMDARYDNYLVETLAVAVSLRVLKAVGSLPARQADIALYKENLPQNVRSAIEIQDWETARGYWQSQIPEQRAGRSGGWDFSFAFLGALILEAAQQPV